MKVDDGTADLLFSTGLSDHITISINGGLNINRVGKGLGTRYGEFKQVAR